MRMLLGGIYHKFIVLITPRNRFINEKKNRALASFLPAIPGIAIKNRMDDLFLEQI